jgi:hypothetical protein
LAPQRGQNWSPPRTGLPHASHVSAGAGSGAGSLLRRPPHCGQKGRPECTFALQNGQAFMVPGILAAVETRVGGTPPPLGVDIRRPPGLMMDATSMTRAPEATIGFPQSMQKRDSPSFSRPQNPQRFTLFLAEFRSVLGVGIL